MSQNITHDNVRADDIAQERRTAYIADIAKGIENKELAGLIAELCDWASDGVTGENTDKVILLTAKFIGKEINRSLELPA